MRTLIPLLLAAGAAHGAPQVIDLLSFEPDTLEAWERLHRQSESLPLTMEELEKLSKAGIGQKALLELMRTRKVLVVADADHLVRLKEAGATDAVVTAVSAYAVRPNDHFDLHVHLDVATPSARAGRAPYLYIEVYNDARRRQDALLYADVRALVKRGTATTARDRSDPLLPQTIHSVRIQGPVRTRDAGRLTVAAFATQRPGLRTLRDLGA